VGVLLLWWIVVEFPRGRLSVRGRRRARARARKTLPRVGAVCQLLGQEDQGRIATVGVQHHVCGKDGVWRQQSVQPHPILRNLLVEVVKESYTTRELRMPQSVTRSIRTDGLADSGAQMTILGARQLAKIGLEIFNVIPASIRIVTAVDNAICG
jgi:hypothetical protein